MAPVKAPITHRPPSTTLASRHLVCVDQRTIVNSTMSISNPSHLLISRNPRSPAHPQLAPTLTARHTPSTSFPRDLNILGTWPSSSDGHLKIPTASSDENTPDDIDDDPEEDEEVVVVHPTFHRDAAMPGRVKVLVGRYEFWCHKEILWFASPFFQSLLEGK